MNPFQLACLIGMAPASVVEQIVPNSQTVAVVLSVPRAHVDGIPKHAWLVLGESLLSGSRHFGPREIADIGNQTGYSPEVRAWPESLQLQVTVPKGSDSLAQGMAMAWSLLMHPSLFDDDVPLAAESLQSRIESPWTQAILGKPRWSAQPIHVDQVRKLHRAAMRPEKIRAFVYGSFEAGAGKSLFEENCKNWAPESVAVSTAPFETPTPETKDGISETVQFGEIGSVIRPKSVDEFATMLVAHAALGAGKSSSLFQSARFRHGWSYLCDGVLSPVRDGWACRLIMVHRKSGDASKRLEQLRQDLLNDVEQWNADDLQRGQKLAAELVSGEFPLGTIWLTPWRTLRQGEADRAALWVNALQLGVDLHHESLTAAIQKVDLATMQATGMQIVSSSGPHNPTKRPDPKAPALSDGTAE